MYPVCIAKNGIFAGFSREAEGLSSACRRGLRLGMRGIRRFVSVQRRWYGDEETRRVEKEMVEKVGSCYQRAAGIS